MPMWIDPVFIVPNGPQSKCVLIEEWIKNICVHTQPPKEGNFAISNTMDGIGGHYAK